MVSAYCLFDNTSIVGQINLANTAAGPTVINSTGLSFVLAAQQTVPHSYQIQPYYFPSGVYIIQDLIGPDNSGLAPWGSGGLLNATMPVGDLSGKHGKISHNTSFGYTDGQVRLSGLISVMGRSIVVFDGAGAELTRCTIAVYSNVFTAAPTEAPTTGAPTESPTGVPTNPPTEGPTGVPTTLGPSEAPTETAISTEAPTSTTTKAPTTPAANTSAPKAKGKGGLLTWQIILIALGATAAVTTCAAAGAMIYAMNGEHESL